MATKFDQGKRSVLIVDDEVDILESMSDVIQDLGYSVTTAISPKMALEIVSMQNFDAILSDINMPEMNGFDFLAHLKAGGHTAPVIFITAAGAEKKNTTSAIRLGAFDFIEKPWTKDEMDQMLSMATEYGMRTRRHQMLSSQPAAELSHQEQRQLELDKKFLALGRSVYNQKRNEQDDE
jgi:two-component system, NtrC family, response regulator AtoC